MHCTREELAAIIEEFEQESGLTSAYYEFDNKEAQEPPFFVWFLSVNTDVHADDQNYVDKEVFNLELYTSYRDFELEKTFDGLMTAKGFSYDKQAAFVQAERIWQISYESEVIING